MHGCGTTTWTCSSTPEKLGGLPGAVVSPSEMHLISSEFHDAESPKARKVVRTRRPGLPKCAKLWPRNDVVKPTRCMAIAGLHPLRRRHRGLAGIGLVIV